MAQIDEKVKSLIEKSYPQAKDASEDPAKLSSAIFSSVEVGTRPEHLARAIGTNTC